MSLAVEHEQDRYRPLSARIHQMEGRDWWLWLYVVLVTVALTIGLGSFAIIGMNQPKDSVYWTDLREWVRGLAALVLLFDIYSLYQHFQLHKMRQLLTEQNHLFRLISENAADMITVVDEDGRSLYDSPACEKILGYSLPELSRMSLVDLVHPEDRDRVNHAATVARKTGQGQRLEYRMSHQNGSWRILDSSMSVVRNSQGQVDRLVIVNRDITENRRAQEKLEYNALHDALTGLPNRTLLMRKLQRVLVRARRHEDYKFALLFIDIDEFKVVNDSLGPAAGDEFLIQIGRRIAVSLRGLETASAALEQQREAPTTEDVLAKLPGDEFTVLLDDIRDPSDALRVCDRIQKNLAFPFNIAGQDIVITASIGIAMGEGQEVQAADILRNAEIAMHRAKRAGKARSEVFDSAMHGSAVRRLQLESELRKGIDRNEFRVVYQPVFALETSVVTGFEALSRWQKPDGVVMPGEFVEVADQTGLMEIINRSLMREAFRNLHNWQASYATPRPLTMSVNVTQRQFAQPNLQSDIGKILSDTGVDPATVELEIIETVAMSTSDPQHSVLGDLRNLGVRLSIDDFGTGYSSLARLQQLPVETLKIDRQFISAIDSSESSREIVRVIVMLAHSMGLKVVAEGVEQEEQVSYLRKIGCDMAQGYFFSRPIDEAGIRELLKPYAVMAQSAH
ncbi:MAG: putative bifunctional diguanylate cyclase/phosphodiesterase [Terriglobales bacterium]